MEKDIEELLKTELNRIIGDCLYGPTGDPDSSHLWAASRAFVLLERLGLPVHDKEEVEGRWQIDAGGGPYLYWARKKDEEGGVGT